MTIRACHRQSIKANTSQQNNSRYEERIVVANCWGVIHASMRRGYDRRDSGDGGNDSTPPQTAAQQLRYSMVIVRLSVKCEPLCVDTGVWKRAINGGREGEGAQGVENE